MAPNTLQGLWLVPYTGADGAYLEGGSVAVDADRDWDVSSDPLAHEKVGVEWPEPMEVDPDEAEMEAFTSLFVDPEMRVFSKRRMEFAPDTDHSETIMIAAVPAADDPVNGIGPEEKHATLLYFGKPSESADPERLSGSKALFKNVLKIAAEETPPFTARVTGVEALGDEGAQVWLLDSPELQTLFSEIPEIDSEIRSMYEDADVTRYDEYLPHVTIGYTGDDSAGSETGESVSDEDMDRAAAVPEVRFDRLSLWWGDERVDFPLGTAEFDSLLEAFGGEEYRAFKVAEGTSGGRSKSGGPDGRTKGGKKVGKKDFKPGEGGGGGDDFKPEDHPRGEAGSGKGGQFIPKDESGGGGSSEKKEESSGGRESKPAEDEEPKMSEAKRAKELANAILDTLKDVLKTLTSKQAKALIEQIEKNAKAFIAGQDGNNGNGGGGGSDKGGGAKSGGKETGPKGAGGKDAPAKKGEPGGADKKPGGGGAGSGGSKGPAGAAGIIEGVKSLIKNFGKNMKAEDRKALEDAVKGLEGL
jgi:hypothetical protein